MIDHELQTVDWNPGQPFYIGLAVVLLAMWFPFVPAWPTFIHMWRVEIAASVFLGATLIYLLVNGARFSFRHRISPGELQFIVLPVAAFVLWSSLSALWAPSWKSALHHSFIWTQYLVFYIIFRELLERRDGFRKLVTVFVLTLLFYAAPAIIEYCAYLAFGGATTVGMRFAKYGEQIVTILPIVLISLTRTRGKRFAIGASAVVLMWLLVFCSMGRINYFLFGSGIAAVFAALLISKRHRKYAPRFVALTALLLLALIPIHLFLIAAPSGGVPILERLNDTEATGSSNNFRKLMLSVSEEMIRANPIVGVGADNFGMQLNRYREEYGAANPADVNLANAEDAIPEHTHNEFVQIVAELGAVGGLIFAWLLAGIGIMAFRAIRLAGSGRLYAFASVLGLGMFLASSMVSSYSFRVMQNGIVFFFVLAVASKLLLKGSPLERGPEQKEISLPYRKLAFSFGVVACLGLIVYSAARVGSVIVTQRANQIETVQSALPLYELAMRLDDENPDARQNLGMRLLRTRRYNEAIPYLESAISIGRAPSAELSYLATAKSLAGDDRGAEETMASAASLYPRSPFVLTRYAALLESNGKAAYSVDMFRRAEEIDERAARTWHTLIASGPKALSEIAARDKAYAPVMDLQPKSSLYAAITDRFIKHPDEQRFSAGKLMADELH
ncbi:MAG TPA: O-antigen ligase family protein [Pyrinomonadaceae bacterium]|nr:O-antigen ligase family protein [Pyrinomonadaceae bacterium]